MAVFVRLEETLDAEKWSFRVKSTTRLYMSNFRREATKVERQRHVADPLRRTEQDKM